MITPRPILKTSSIGHRADISEKAMLCDGSEISQKMLWKVNVSPTNTNLDLVSTFTRYHKHLNGCKRRYYSFHTKAVLHVLYSLFNILCEDYLVFHEHYQSLLPTELWNDLVTSQMLPSQYAIPTQSNRPNSRKWPKTYFLALRIIQKCILGTLERSSMTL